MVEAAFAIALGEDGAQVQSRLSPRPTPLLIRHGLNGSDDVLKLGNLTQGATGGHPVVLGHRQDEIALVGLEAVEEDVELFGHQEAVVARFVFDNKTGNFGPHLRHRHRCGRREHHDGAVLDPVVAMVTLEDLEHATVHGETAKEALTQKGRGATS